MTEFYHHTLYFALVIYIKDTLVIYIKGSLPEIAQYSPYYLPLNVLIASKGTNLYILFAITAAGVVPCGGRKKSPRTSSIVQIIFLFRSFEISKDI